MKLTLFKETDFLNAVKALFTELNVPMNYVADEPTTAKKILKDTYKENSTFNLIDDVYFVGMVDDAAFDGNESISTDKIKSDYDGVLIFGITLNQRENNLLPTRSQLAEISRAFNREFYYTPVVLVFKYSDNANEYIAFANTERLKYKQEWREGEKAGKVSLLRDINIEKPHRGHKDIINQLKIPTSGTKQVDSFAKLYNYWQEVFSVSILNKKFYQELQNWYFWAIKEVTFPNQPKILDENIDGDETKLKEAIKEHKGKNVIRLLTRILFVWFIKEKKLIPEEIFDEQTIADKLIDDFTPQKPYGVFATGKHNSKYYRAILQNLFFATLNQEMGKRTFRNDKQHQNVTNLMRYKSYFKDPDYFVNLMEDVVPFMNGGLFECLDKSHPDKKGRQGGDIIIYTDGFSDRDDNFLEVPDYLFFDVDEDVDLSDDFGSKAKVYKNAKTRGLLKILKSYKFTITENTPIEEDVALDPELLGKVFENLLASYNPETKTTARKQTGSFYTQREIVNYMVDESLIAYLKNTVNWNNHLNSSPDKGRWSQTGGVNNSSLDKGRWSQTGGVNNLPKLKTFRKNLRNNLTPAEATLWKYLQGKKLEGRKFRRQHSVANYILDFYCPSEKLAIELDGQGHFEATQAEYDYERDLFLKHLGIKVLRFENKVVWNNIEGLLEAVKKEFGWYDKQPPRPTDTPPFKGGELLDTKLHQLTSFDNINPFADYPNLQKQIIKALDNAKILDPAAGSGAFPMGVLQKMVHVLHKIDPNNIEWKQRQIDKVNTAIESLEEIDDVKFREQSIKELKAQIKDIEDAFENNELDYGRKLFLIENCIYGVDIQSIAIQISKLRFFISLIVDQKIEKNKPNFGVRPLPNLETKFVAANTLIGIDKPDSMQKLFEQESIQKLETELKNIRHKIFSLKSPSRKKYWRNKDKEVREELSKLIEEQLNKEMESSIKNDRKTTEIEYYHNLIKKNGKKESYLREIEARKVELEKLRENFQSSNHKTAQQLAKWDPYDQNASSPFFDPEWMFDIKEGFDVVIGNPPYKILTINNTEKVLLDYFLENYAAIKKASSKNLYTLFIECAIALLKNDSQLSFIVPEGLYQTRSYKGCVELMENYGTTTQIITFSDFVFENAVTGNLIFLYQSTTGLDLTKFHFDRDYKLEEKVENRKIEIEEIEKGTIPLKNVAISFKGMVVKDRKTVLSESRNKDVFLLGKNISKWRIDSCLYTDYNDLVIVGGTKKLEKHNHVPRILVRRTGETLCCAFLTKPALTESTLYSVWSINSEYSDLFLFGVLNSKLLNHYNKIKNITNKQGFPQILMTDLESLPIKKIHKIVAPAIELLSNLLQINQGNVFEIVLDALVFNLYFPDHMKEREIDVLEYVEWDIASVWAKHPALQSQKPEAFDTLSDAEKEEIINQLHQIWTDPDNEVVKRMAQFKEKSPDILKPILES